MKLIPIITILLFTVVYIVPLGVRPMVIPDETRYAEIAREMLRSGDWIVPHLAQTRYFEKPVLGYWLNATSIKLFGENNFAVRLPSALAVGVSAIMIFLLICKFGGGKTFTGFLAVGVFLTFCEVFLVGVFCVLDSVFSMFITAAMVSFFAAYSESPPGKKLVYLTICGIFSGLAFLTKGFIGFAVPLVIAVPFLLWQRQTIEMLKVLYVPVIAAILVVLPWAIAVHFREADYWHYFFWEEHVRRFFSGDAQHAKPLWYYIPVLAGGALPWTAVVPAVILRFKKEQFKEPFIRFVLCWLIFPFLFFSASGGKLATYILPCYLPLGVLIALSLQEYRTESKKGNVIFAAALLVFAALVAIVHLAVPNLRMYDSTETWKWMFLIAGIVLCSIVLLLAASETNYWRKLALRCIAPACIMFVIPFIIPDRFKDGKMPADIIMKHAGRIRSNTVLISDDYTIPAVCWFYDRSDVYILGKGGEFTYGLSYSDSSRRLVRLNNFESFLQAHSYMRKTVIIMTAKRYAGDKEKLPKPSYEDSADGFVFVEYKNSDD
jgi:4-amino-4-deoxy-L-arabinose transferase